MILATDLDGTFLGGKSLHKQQLYRLIRKDTTISLVFVTGRGLETVIPLLNDPIIPNPDFIICDVGATVVNGHTLEAVQPLQNDIEKNWPGLLKIQECLKDIDELHYQEVPQQRRCSFYADNKDRLADITERMEAIGCDVIYSANKFLDILPKGVNKGSTLTRLLKYLKADMQDVLVAGDTLNDLSMFQCGLNGVVVGEAEPALTESTSLIPNVHKARLAGAGGILESIRHFERLAHYFSSFDEQVIEEEQTDAPQLVMMYHRFPYELK
ncbi:MAG TPA: HAD-IIB family hydrolase, partial [Chitinophagaceae bacterium]|nr:HAD-IIB family hydrolase [Chitinophagaceae bacterium]